MAQVIPILLLKTRSKAADGYEEVFSSFADGLSFQPTFVPVLEHTFEDGGMSRLQHLLQSRKIGRSGDCKYGGLIFTSQRAVEAFSHLIHARKAEQYATPGPDLNLTHGLPATDDQWPHLQEIPIYSVGPATTRALSAVHQQPPLQVFGEHTGNGDNLARFILQHYRQWYHDRATKPPLLFLVGEQRRDVIPKALMDSSLPAEARIQLDELVVYGTGVMASFRDHLTDVLAATDDRTMRWIVVFSPTGCETMLRGLGMLDEQTGRARPEPAGCRTLVITIGPTTRDYLVRRFGFEPHVCSEKPSPEGVLNGIVHFIKTR